MAYYTPLITAWNSPTVLPSGVTGTLLSGLSTANKIIAINGWILTGSVPSTFQVSGAQVLNCINWPEFAALTAQQQNNIFMACAGSSSGMITGGAGTFIGGMFVAYFSLAGPTIAALTALAKGISMPWWQATVAQGGAGLGSTISLADLSAAGGLT